MTFKSSIDDFKLLKSASASGQASITEAISSFSKLDQIAQKSFLGKGFSFEVSSEKGIGELASAFNELDKKQQAAAFSAIKFSDDIYADMLPAVQEMLQTGELVSSNSFMDVINKNADVFDKNSVSAIKNIVSLTKSESQYGEALDVNKLKENISAASGTELSAVQKEQAISAIGSATATTAQQNALNKLTIAETAAAVAGKVLKAAAFQIAIAAVTFVIEKAVDSIVNFKEEYQKLDETLRNAEDAYDEAKKDVDDLASKIENVGKQIDEINDKEIKSPVDDQTLSDLERENTSLSAQLELKKQLAAQKNAEVNQATYNASEDRQEYISETETESYESYDGTLGAATLTRAKRLTRQEYLDEQITKYKDLQAQYDALDKSAGDYADQEQNLHNQLDATATNIGTVTKEISDNIPEATGANQDWVDSQTESVEAGTEVIKSNNILNGVYSEIAETVEDAAQAVSNVNAIYDSSVDTFSELNTKMGNLQSAYKTLLSAQDEYNKNGYLTMDTLQSVLDLGDDYIDYLVDENGQVNFNGDAIERLANAYLDDLEAKQLDQACNLMSTFTEDGKAAEYLSSQMEYVASTTIDAANASLKLAEAQAIAKAQSEGLSEGAMENIRAACQKVASNFRDYYTVIESTRAGLGNYTSETLNAADATDKLSSATEKEQNRLKIYGKAAIDEIQKRIDKLNDEKDAYEKDIQAQIDKLNEQKDAQDKAYEDRVDQLNEQKTAVDDLNDAEDRELKLAQLRQALAEAQASKTKRVYVEGQGYIWQADQQAIDDAQKALDDQLRENARDDAIKAIEDEIDAINDEKDAYDDAIAAEIDDLNDKKDKFDENIANEIDKLNDLKDKYQEAMDLIGTSYEDYQMQLQAADEFSKMSYDNMSAYVVSYKDTVVENMRQIEDASKKAAAAQSAVTGGGSHEQQYVLTDTLTGKELGTYSTEAAAAAARKNKELWHAGIPPTISAHANGTLGVYGDEFANVDERGSELIIRKPAVGRYTYLENGDGVVPADITSRLFEMGGNPLGWLTRNLTSLGSLSLSGAGASNVAIGDIIIQNPVGNVDQLAQQIQMRLPNVIVQKLNKR